MADNRLVKDYLRDWLPAHAARHSAAHPPYPAVGTPEYARLYSDWFDELKRNNVDGDEAEAASKALLTHADAAFRNNHLRLLLDNVEAARKLKLEGTIPIVARMREEAEARSRHCPHCGGAGLAYRVRRDGEPWHLETRVGLPFDAAQLLMACTCPLGRWMLAAHGHKPPWPDLAAYLTTTLNPRADEPAAVAAGEPAPF